MHYVESNPRVRVGMPRVMGLLARDETVFVTGSEIADWLVGLNPNAGFGG